MPRYQLKSPQGKTYEINAPEGASQADVLTYFRKQLASQAQTPQPAMPDYMQRVLKEGGVPEPDQQRLMSTGITPGTAPEWASAHIAMRQAQQGEALDQGMQEAIFDLYKRQAGRQDVSSQDFYAQQRQQSRAERGETLAGRAQNVGIGVLSGIGQMQHDITGLVAPGEAERLGTEYQAFLNPDTESLSGRAGQLSGEIVKLGGLAATGPLGMAGVYGAQGAGGQRREVRRLRAGGHEVSGGAEALTALGVGGAEAVSGYVGGRLFQSMGGVLRSASPTLRTLLEGGSKQATRQLLSQAVSVAGHAFAEGGEEAATQLVTNLIRQGVNPDAALTEGVTEAFAMGAILSPFGAVGAQSTVSPGQQVDTPTATVETPASQQTDAAIQDPTRMLPDERAVVQRELREAQTAVDEAVRPETQESSPEPVMVDEAGQAVTGPQRKAVEGLRQEMLTPETDPSRMLPGTTARFVGGEQGLMDFQPEDASPQAAEGDRRSSEVSDAVSEEATSIIEGLSQRGELTDAQEQQIRSLVSDARRNPLTGGMNRNAFEKVFDAVRRRSRKNKRPVSVIALDAANLKTFNDVIGESAGDEYLRRVQKTIEGALRTGGDERIGDAFHYGGDEWAVVLPDTDAEGAAAVRQRIEDAFGQEEIIPGVSAFLVGGSETVAPGSKREWRAILDKAAKEMKTRKAAQKAAMGEPTTRAEAEAKAAAAVQEEGGDVQDVRPDRKAPAVREALRQLRQKQQQLQEVDSRVAEQMSQARQSVKQTAPLAGTKHKRRVPRTVEAFLTPLSSRIKDLSNGIYNRLMRMEFNTGVARETLKRELSGPATRLRESLRSSNKEPAFKAAVLNQDFDGARKILDGVNSELLPDFDQFVGTFRNLLDNQRAAGVTIGDVDNYWPRFVRDYNAFDKAFGDDKGRFERAFDLAKKTLGRRVLTKEQRAEIANSVIQGYGPQKPGSYGPPNARSRRIDRISAEQLEHYIDPFEAAMRYIDGATYAAERARFLGRNHTIETMGETIGTLVDEEVQAGTLDAASQDEMIDLLTARFTADMLKPSKAVRNFKQLIYLTTLGQFRSVLTQLTDAAITIADHGVEAWFVGMKGALHLTSRDKRVMMEDIGIHDHGEEFKDIGAIAESLDWTLDHTGFKAIDRVGKESRINAAKYNMAKAAVNPRSRLGRRMKRDYQPILGEAAYKQAMHDLRRGVMSENVRYMLFLDITKIQPVVTSQMPQKYLESPTGRIMYALKTFTLMQLDHVRRDMIRKIQTPGQRVEGVKHLGRYIAWFSLVGLGVQWLQDWIRGKVWDADDLPDEVLDSMLGCIGLNRYTVSDAWSNPSDAAINFIAPPMSWLDSTVQDLTSKSSGIRSIRNIPVVGELLYYWAPFGRGYQLNAAEAKADYRAKLQDLRTEAADAVRHNDLDYARQLMAIYNERRKQGPGDGRKSPLTITTLRRDLRRDVRRTRERTAP